ncbi:MAG: DUF2892 domain-containing protein [candidate division KSB1 bacterium]|nr:DUF2892 domain-containing protein [candidate division KSB1 bacterium]MDZ7305182.1 DUF2892 domain-containing protein [candidate division KSB1 bacterium]MDZ7314268.1 DUF2892 domain-containing protein [candidate division KSB1 bacterium]
MGWQGRFRSRRELRDLSLSSGSGSVCKNSTNDHDTITQRGREQRNPIVYKNWLGLIGLVPILTVAIGWCTSYVPFRITTCKTNS